MLSSIQSPTHPIHMRLMNGYCFPKKFLEKSNQCYNYQLNLISRYYGFPLDINGQSHEWGHLIIDNNIEASPCAIRCPKGNSSNTIFRLYCLV
jgi:hypothetical protein